MGIAARRSAQKRFVWENHVDAYDALYTELTLTDRVLSKHEHEIVWMAILIACEEALGECGGTQLRGLVGHQRFHRLFRLFFLGRQ